MRSFHCKRQKGAVLLIALIMLLILTVLAATSMRGVTLESRITGNRAHNMQLQNAAEAALREAEFRLYGPGHLRDKLEPNAENCSKSNKLQKNGANKPCLLALQADDSKLREFIVSPQKITESSKSHYLDASSAKGLAWMPYRGLDADRETKTDVPAQWNCIIANINNDTALNVEYGASLEGRGTYFYLANGQADNKLTLQSTTASIYLGLNN